jgi:hypothetical protein
MPRRCSQRRPPISAPRGKTHLATLLVLGTAFLAACGEASNPFDTTTASTGSGNAGSTGNDGSSGTGSTGGSNGGASSGINGPTGGNGSGISHLDGGAPDASWIEDDAWAAGPPKTWGDGSVAADAPPGARFMGAPRITSVLPQTVVAGHAFVVNGENLTDVFWNTAGVHVVLSPQAAGASASRELTILRGMPSTLILVTPPGLEQVLPGPDKLEVTTPTGTARSPSPIFVVGTNGFGTGVGEGLFGAVYALTPDAIKLPNFGDPRELTAPCADPKVRKDTTADCPFNSIIVPNLNIPLHQFTDGFLGVGETLIEFFAIRFRGMLTIDQPGTYAFRLCSDDGSNLYLLDSKAEAIVADAGWSDGGASGLTPLIANDGVHEDTCKTAAIDIGTAGTYPVIVDYFQGPRFHVAIRLFWTPPGGVEEIVPPTHLTALLP